MRKMMTELRLRPGLRLGVITTLCALSALVVAPPLAGAIGPSKSVPTTPARVPAVAQEPAPVAPGAAMLVPPDAATQPAPNAAPAPDAPEAAAEPAPMGGHTDEEELLIPVPEHWALRVELAQRGYTNIRFALLEESIMILYPHGFTHIHADLNGEHATIRANSCATGMCTADRTHLPIPSATSGDSHSEDASSPSSDAPDSDDEVGRLIIQHRCAGMGDSSDSDDANEADDEASEEEAVGSGDSRIPPQQRHGSSTELQTETNRDMQEACDHLKDLSTKETNRGK